MEFKKTVAGISAAAIAVTQVAAVIPMGAFAATTAVDSANVQFALNYKASGKTNSAKAAASEKKATVNAADITSVEDFGLSFNGEITSSDLADGDKYTFTANGLTVTAKEKDTTVAEKSEEAWAGSVDLDGTTEEGKLTVTDAGSDGDKVVITYTEDADASIKVSGVEAESGSADGSKTLSFTLDETTAKSFDIVGSGVTVTKIEVTSTSKTTLLDTETALTTDESKTVTVENGAVGDTVVITYAETSDFEGEKTDVTVTGIDNGVNGEGTYTFELTEETKDSFTVTGNGYTVSSIKLTHTATEDKTPAEGTALTSTKTPGSVTVAAEKFANAVDNGSVKVTYAVNTTETAGSVVIKAGSVEIATTEAAADKTEVTVALDADKAAAVKADGIVITGTGITVSKVELVTPGSTTKGGEVTLFTGSDESVVWSETYAAETQTWETLAEDTAKTTVSTDKLALDNLSAFSDKYENITATWTELTAVKVTPDPVGPTEVPGTLSDTLNVDLSKNYIKFDAVADAAVDGTITVGVKDTDGAAVVLKDADGTQLDTKTVADDAASVVFTLTEEQAAKVAENGFIIAGTKGTVTSVAYKAKEEVKPTEKNTVTKDIGFTDAEGINLADNKIQINASEMAADGKITVTLKDNVTNEIVLKEVAEGNAEIVKAAPVDGSVVFTLTAEQAEKAAQGFIVEADAGVVTGVAYAEKQVDPEPEDKTQTIKEFTHGNVPVSELGKATKVKFTVDVTTLNEGNGSLMFYVNTNAGWKQVDYTTTESDKQITKTGEMTAEVEFDLDGGNWYQAGVKTSNPEIVNGTLVKAEFLDDNGEVVGSYDPNAASISKENFTFSTLKNEDMKIGDSFTITYNSKNTPKTAKYYVKYKIHAPNDPSAWEEYIYPIVINSGKIDNSASKKTGLEVTSSVDGDITTFTFTAVSKSTVEPFGVNIEISAKGDWSDTDYLWYGDVSFLVKSADAEETTKIAINSKNFPDSNLQKVMKLYSADGKNLTESEIAKITDLGNAKADEKFATEAATLAKVKNFKGIENLTALASITLNPVVSGKTTTVPAVTALDLSKNTALVSVNVSGCTKLAALTLPETATVEKLLLQNTAIKEIDVSKYTALTVLNVSDTKLTALDVKANTALETLALANVKVGELDVTANTALTEIDAANCGLEKIDVSKNTALETLDVSKNSLVALDLTGLSALKTLNAAENTRKFGAVVDGEYDIAKLAADGLDTAKMTIKTEGVERTENVLTGVTEKVEYEYSTGLEAEGLDKVTFTLAPEKITSNNFVVKYTANDKEKEVVCATWDEVLKEMTNNNVDYTVEVEKDTPVDNLKMPTASKAKSVTVVGTDKHDLKTITTKSTSVSLPVDVTFENVKIVAVGKDGKTPAKTFTLNASKNLTVEGFEIDAQASTVKGGTKSVLTIKGSTIINSAVTGFGTLAMSDAEAEFHNTVKVKDIKLAKSAIILADGAAFTVTNIEANDSSDILYSTAAFKPVAVTGNITGNSKLNIGIYYKKSAEEGQDAVTVSTFNDGDIVLVSKTANLASVTVENSVPEDATYTLARVGSDVKVMAAKMTLTVGESSTEFAQWSDVLSTIAANAKAGNKTADYTVTLTKELDVKGALKMPAAKTFGSLTIKSVGEAQTVTFTGNLSITGKTAFENVKLDSVKTVKGVSKSNDFTISAGKNELTLTDVKTGANIKTVSSSGVLTLDNVAVNAVNGATVVIKNTSNAVVPGGKLVDGEWKGEAAPDTSVIVNGNLTAKTALNFVGDDAGLRVKGVVNAAKITADTEDSAVLVVDKLAKNKNALVIGKNGFDNSSNAVKFVLMDTETNLTAQITENLTLGTIAGPYADQLVPSDSNLAEDDSYYIVKSGKNLVAVPKQTKGDDDQMKDYLVEVTVNGKKAYYKTLDEAIKDISATGKATDEYSIKLTGDQKFAKLPLPSAGKYGQLLFTADNDVKIDVTSDLTLTGNVVLDEHISLNKVDKNKAVQPISINVGKYVFVSSNPVSSITVDDETYSQINNISGKGAFGVTGDITVSGKVNVDTFIAAGTTTLGDRSAFAASSILTIYESDSTLKYPASIGKNVKFGTVETYNETEDDDNYEPLTLDITGDIKSGDQVAALTGTISSEMFKLTEELQKNFVLARSGNKLVVLDVESIANAVYMIDYTFGTGFIFDNYANAINEINRVKDKDGEYEIAFYDGEHELSKLTLPAKGKYKTLTFDCMDDEDDAVVLSVKGNTIALTGNLVVDGDVTLKQADGKELKFTSAKNKDKDKTPVYTVTVKGNAKIEKGTLNGTEIKNPDPTPVDPEPTEPTVVEGTLPYSGEVDLSANVLKIAKADVAEKGTITVTLKDNVETAIVLNDAEGNKLTEVTPDAEAASVVFTLTAEQAEKITANGFTLTGTAGVVTAVAYEAPVTPEPAKKTEVSVTELPYNNAEGVDLSANVLKVAAINVVENGTITVTLKANVKNAIVLQDKDGTVLATATPTENATSVTFTITADQIAKIKADGFTVTGDAGIVTDISYDSGNETPEVPIL